MEQRVRKSWMTDVMFSQKETFAKGIDFRYFVQKV